MQPNHCNLFSFHFYFSYNKIVFHYYFVTLKVENIWKNKNSPSFGWHIWDPTRGVREHFMSNYVNRSTNFFLKIWITGVLAIKDPQVMFKSVLHSFTDVMFVFLIDSLKEKFCAAGSSIDKLTCRVSGLGVSFSSSSSLIPRWPILLFWLKHFKRIASV